MEMYVIYLKNDYRKIYNNTKFLMILMRQIKKLSSISKVSDYSHNV